MEKLKSLITKFDCIIYFRDDIGANGITVKRLDNGYTMFINGTLSYEKTIEIIEHEMWHIILGHLDENKHFPTEWKESEVAFNMESR